MTPRLVVFDWDGTLMDSTGRIVASVQAAARDLGRPPPPATRVRRVIGLGLEQALGEAMPDLRPAEMSRFVERYRSHYLDPAGPVASTLFPGARELLDELRQRGCWLAVATGKGRQGLDRALGETRLADYFLATRCAGECRSKPHPEMLESLLDELGLTPEQAMMIGDTTWDLQMAHAARVPVVAVDYGAHSRRELLRLAPLACLSGLDELRRWFSRLPAGRARDA
jgi:phosphoglycolate phosphatase